MGSRSPFSRLIGGALARVPAIIISPFAKRHFVDHLVYDTTSMLSLSKHAGISVPLGARDASAVFSPNSLQS